MVDTSVEHLGLKLRNPLIAASSGITRDTGKIVRCADAGFGCVIMKSLFEDEVARRDPSPKYTILDRNGAKVFYSYEQASEFGPDRYAEELRRAIDEVDIPVIPSINCMTEPGWRDFAKRMQDSGARAVEMNVSCPYGSVTSEGDDPETQIYKAVEAVLDSVTIPVSVKIPGRLTSPAKVVAKIEEMGASGVVMFNRFAGLDIDVETMKPIMHGGAAGHGGAFSIHYPLLWVSRLSGITKMSVAGSGGVAGPDDMIKYLLAGADAVQICTSVYMNGYEIAGNYLTSLKEWMRDKGHSSISDFRGKVSGSAVLGMHDVVRDRTVGFRIDDENCTSCDICRQRCAYEAITAEGGKYEIIQETCVSCGFCEQVCPVGVIGTFSLG